MKKSGFKKLLCLAVAALSLLFCAQLTAGTVSEPDLSRICSLTVDMKDSDTGAAVPGGKMTLYRVGAALSQSGGYSFVLTDEFAPSNLELTDPESAHLASQLADYAGKNRIAGAVKSIGSDGRLVCSGMQTGLYLLVQTVAAKDYLPANPFLVTLPMCENGEYIYDVDAAPKTGTVKTPVNITVEIIWDDEENEDRPGQIVVQLLNGDVVIDSVTLSEKNGWRHVWEDLPRGSSYSYSVRQLNLPEQYTEYHEGDTFSFVITNVARKKPSLPSTTEVTVEKRWNDGNSPDRPQSVDIQLLDGKSIVGTVTLNSRNSWRHSWTDLPESDCYSVREKNVPSGYTDSYGKDGSVLTVTNTSLLVQTGQIILPIVILALAGIALLVVGFLLYRRGKRRD